MPPTTQCPQCEAAIPASAHFCPACGLRQPGTPEPPPLPEPRHWRGRKFVLWFLAMAATAGVLFLGSVLYFVRHTTIVTTGKDGGGRAEAPFGTLSSSRNPAKLAHSLGLDVYPGAQGIEGTQAQLAHSVIVSIEFRSTASPADIIHYYHIRYPDASVSLNPHGRTLVQLNPRGTMTIQAQRTGGRTRILVSDIRH